MADETTEKPAPEPSLRERAEAALRASKDAQRELRDAEVAAGKACDAYRAAIVAEYACNARFAEVRAQWIVATDAEDAHDHAVALAIDQSCETPSILMGKPTSG